MAEYAQLKAAINAVIKQNGRMEITGEVLNQVLTAMVNSLGRSMGCAGVATPATNPQSPDQNLFYFAVQAGTYVNFNSIVLPAGISVLMWNGTWTAQTWFTIKDAPEYQSTDFISAGGVFDSQKVDGNAYDISEHFPTGGVNNTNEYTLSGALAKIPANMYKAGMAIKFKESTTHNYVVFTHVGSDTTNFTSLSLWQGVANSNELFHSPNAVMRKQIPTIGAVLDEFGTQNVQTLPTPSNATMNRIFVVQSKNPETDNIKTEWITIKVGNTYQWECIGGDTTSIYDLSDAMAVDGEPATYNSLTDALAAVPADKKRTGMTLAFIELRADVYKLSTWENSEEPTGNAVEVDQIYLYGEKNYTLDELHDMFSSYDGEPIDYPSQVGGTLKLYSLNSFTNLYNIQQVELLRNQRTYEQYRFVGTNLNDFADESLWIKETKVPTKNGELNNNRNYATQEDIYALQPNWDNMQEVTWDELVELRDNEELVAGKFYRITDYLTTTTQAETQSAGHQFEVIVMALTAHTLSERAWAALFDEDDEDSYFEHCDLAAWQLWYCLDNDTSRFAWADEENGKGVIYRMIDEWGNDCPYDFKNIMFEAHKVTADYRTQMTIGHYTFAEYNDIEMSEDSEYLYTFSYIFNGEVKDTSVGQYSEIKSCNNNIVSSKQDGRLLPFIAFVHDASADSIFLYGFVHNVIGDGSEKIIIGDCTNGRIGRDCRNIFVASESSNITIYENLSGIEVGGNSIVIGNATTSVVIEQGSKITIGDDCDIIMIDADCSNINLGNNCREFYLGRNCENINIARGLSLRMEEGCRHIVVLGALFSLNFARNCEYLFFQGKTDEMTFEMMCSRMRFGIGVKNCYFGRGSSIFSVGNNVNDFKCGNYCTGITIGDDCNNIRFGNEFIHNGYYRNISISQGTDGIDLECAVAVASNNEMRNINIAKGFKAVGNNRIPIVHPTTLDAYCTTYEPTGSQTIQVQI